MKRNFTLALLLILSLTVLISYNNCGPLSHRDKTSTQATNPGDFGDGGDDGGGNTVRMLIRRVISDLCTVTTSIDTQFDYTECGFISETQPYIVQTFYDDPSILNLNILAQKINNKELFIDGALMSECNAHIDNFPITVGEINVYGIELAIEILRKSPSCLSFIHSYQESEK